MKYTLLSYAVTVCGVLLILSLPQRLKKTAALPFVIVAGALHFISAITALRYGTIEFILHCGFPFGLLPLRIDALSAFFLIVVNITLITGAWYGSFYMRMYGNDVPSHRDSMHWSSFLVLQAGMSGVCILQNIIAFIMCWEVMTVSAFLLVIYDSEKKQTLRAGMNYFIQSHICVLLIITGFIWAGSAAGSTDMHQIFASARSGAAGMGPWPFIILFTGFAFKAGFVPFHTWLPWAHPAAPSHVSGVMSGVIIKMGIYGIFRSLPLCQGNMLQMGRFILIISVMSALYGVMLAIIQHNLKRLLAYHSIENIGIIGMGMGLGLMGTGMGNATVAMAGYCGALLHTLNHSLFKSLLFYTTGTVYRMAHRVNIEELGGLMKIMPFTAAFFLVPALAITGLPPFNGFISEFLIYSSMYTGLSSGAQPVSMLMLCCIFGLVMVGGLAFLCFTKAFGIVFLGTPRHHLPEDCGEVEKGAMVPQCIVLFLILSIGLVPAPFVKLVSIPASMLLQNTALAGAPAPSSSAMNSISAGGAIILIICALIFTARHLVMRQTGQRRSPVWGCGYTGGSPRIQYTATSFVQSYINIASPVLRVHAESPELKGLFPAPGTFRSHTYDKIEEKLIDHNLNRFARLLGVFSFLQNGLVQYYILYGVLFIIAILAFTFRQAIFSFFISFLALG